MRRKQALYSRPKQFGRELRVAEFIRGELTDLIRRKMRDPRIDAMQLTVTDVRVSRDLAFADIFVACSLDLEDEAVDQSLSVLQQAAGFFRSELAKRHDMRTTPELRFHLDRTDREAQRIDELLAEARNR